MVIFLFLGSVRSTLVPAITVPVSLVGTFFVLYLLGFSINLLTLLAMVLAIGLVVDDAIVVLENISRRTREGESPLRASFLGSRQVAFAVVATTIVLIAVLGPDLAAQRQHRQAVRGVRPRVGRRSVRIDPGRPDADPGDVFGHAAEGSSAPDVAGGGCRRSDRSRGRTAGCSSG